MSEVEVYKPEIEDWPSLLNTWMELKRDRHHAFRIDGDAGDVDLRTYFKLSLIGGMFQIFMVRCKKTKTVWGFAITSLGTHLGIKEGLPYEHRNLFVRAVYVYACAPREATMELQKFGEDFARANGCKKMFGHCRIGFPAKAAEKIYGWKSANTIMEKELI